MPSLMCSWKLDSFGEQKLRAIILIFNKTQAGHQILMKRLWLNQLIKLCLFKTC